MNEKNGRGGDYIVTPIGPLRLEENPWLNSLVRLGNTKAVLSCTDIGRILKKELHGEGNVDWEKITPILVQESMRLNDQTHER